MRNIEFPLACNEFESLGYIETIDKRSAGRWQSCYAHGEHYRKVRN